jgi:hypothetical protein
MSTYRNQICDEGDLLTIAPPGFLGFVDPALDHGIPWLAAVSACCHTAARVHVAEAAEHNRILQAVIDVHRAAHTPRTEA